MNIASIVARNYLAHARVLATSYRTHNPAGEIHVLVIDETDEQAGRDEPFVMVRLEQIFSADEIRALVDQYDVLELATAVKPRFLEYLLNQDGVPVAYLDPDIQVYGPLDALDAPAIAHEAVVTPHMLTPPPLDGRKPSETEILVAGTFNLGFVAVGPKSKPLLAWWWDRLRNQCRIDHARGLHVDQKWMDMTPSYFDIHVLRDPGFNVAYWNIYERPLTRKGGVWMAAGSPLRFFHFSGYDPDRPEVLSKHALPKPRTLLEAGTELRRLTDAYGANLRRHGFDDMRSRPYARKTGGRVHQSRNRPPGINVIGYLHAELGVGEAGRRTFGAVEAAGIDRAAVSYHNLSSRQDHVFDTINDNPYNVNLVCINADRLADFAMEKGPGFFQGRYNIGLWWWEAGTFPVEWHDRFDMVDEIWVGSQYIANVLEPLTHRPIKVFVPPLQVKPVPPVAKAQFGLPDRFMFLFTYDFFSILERKNPIGLIQAFTEAFPNEGGPILVLKSINGNRKKAELERVRAAASHRSDIIVMDGYLEPEQKDALMAACDCYVSLHRAEGLGLTMAEAMARGKPCIATAYSGNLEFMTPQTSFLVSYHLGTVPHGCEPYPAGSIWAEPNLDMAAKHMRSVFENPSEARKIGEAARHHIEQKFGLVEAARIVNERFDDIQARLNRGDALVWDQRQQVPQAPPPVQHLPSDVQALMWAVARRPRLRALAVGTLSMGYRAGRAAHRTWMRLKSGNDADGKIRQKSVGK